MKSSTRLLFVTLLLAAAGLGFYAWREQTRQTAQRRALEEQIGAARTTLDRTQREREAEERELATLTRAAKDAAAAAAARAAAPAPNPVATAWDQKVATLHSLLAQHPQWAIPEIGLLTPDEFIFFARDAQLDSEETQRKALRDLRALAKRKLVLQLHQALDDYALANGGRLPADLRELTSLFKTPVPDTVLNRYALVGLAAIPAKPGDEPLLYERVPVDELYDTRQVLGTLLSTQVETNPAIYVLTRALAAFAEANPGRTPTQPAELGPYLEVPLDDPTLARYFTAWQKQPGNLGIRRAFGGVTIFRPLGSPR